MRTAERLLDYLLHLCGGGDETKAVVLYDSYYGNTKQVAEAIAEEIQSEGHQANLRSLRERSSAPIEGDILFIGSPTRFGKMTRRSKRFVNTLSKRGWGQRPVIAFDTVMPMPDDPKEHEKAKKWIEYGAAPRIRDLARSKGLNARPEVLRAQVSGMKGPLSEGEIERTKKFVQQTLESLPK